MKYKIVSDSSIDIKSLEGVVFEIAPLKIITDEREYVDDNSLDASAMMADLLKYKGRSHTSCPNSAEYLECFGDAENVFCITITGNLSGSFNAAFNAAREYEAAHPERRVHVINSLSTGPENALLAEKLRDLILQGKDFDEIKNEITEYNNRTALLFALESMHNLARNGRVSPIAAKLAGVLGIRAIGRASDEGTLEMLDKVRGARNTVEAIVGFMKKFGFASGKVKIHHADNPECAEELRTKILESFPSSKITVGRAGGLCSFYAERGGLLVGFET